MRIIRALERDREQQYSGTGVGMCQCVCLRETAEGVEVDSIIQCRLHRRHHIVHVCGLEPNLFVIRIQEMHRNCFRVVAKSDDDTLPRHPVLPR